MNFEKLNNPVFYSLSETHQNFCQDFGNLKVYQPATNPFGGFSGIENSSEELDQYSEICSEFFILGNKPHFSQNMQLKAEIICNQMICPDKIIQNNSEEIVHLNGKFENELYALVQEFYPGFFRKNTSLLGNYYGIIRNGKLVAVTGERFQMDDFCEVSAVVTHRAFEGLGFARQLVAFVANQILEKGKIPFLHVDERNIRAIALYEKLGFALREKINVWYFAKK